MERTFRVKKTSGSTVYRITVPAEIARMLEGIDLIPTLTEEGLVYRPVTPEERPPAAPPTWAQRALEASN